jgi:predicted ATPase
MTDAGSPQVIQKVVLKNFRRFRDTKIEFSPGLNILVGDNEAGKSTVLEAVNLALTSRWQGKFFATELAPHFISLEATNEYLQAVRDGEAPEPPEIVVELFLVESADTVKLKGTNNSLGDDTCGLRITAHFDKESFAEEYQKYVEDKDSVQSVPTEYYKVEWYDFGAHPVNPRAIKVSASLIDASRIRLQSGADYYLQRIITESLDPKQRAQLSRAFRTLQESFADDDSIRTINEALDASQQNITDKRLTMEINASQANQWDSALAPHLDSLPLHVAGSGEQNKLKILLALARKVEDAHLILIEEPENHLSFSSLNQLIEKIGSKCEKRQVVISTHSSFVINKLGLDRLMLLSGDDVTRTTDLPADTLDYFKKLSGYDTLRLVLAKAVILVEGPSDELIVQRAYRDKYGKLPIENGIDVINVRGLSAKRFLDLAVPLARRVAVVNDNDGDFDQKVTKRYADYSAHSFITIHASNNNDFKTLEPQIVASTGLATVNTVLAKTFTSDDEASQYMVQNKTDSALAFFETDQAIIWPQYIQDAVDGIGE